VGRSNPGTRRLRRLIAQLPAVVAGRTKAVAKARDPERRAKIAAAKRGKPRPRHVIAKLILTNTGRPLSAETRRKLSEAQRRRGTRPHNAGPPWTVEEDEAVRTLPPQEAARRTGRTLRAVYARRRQLGLPDGRRRF
jgi:hypothetical protein